ncbi:MAG: hypothetical protein JOZ43_07940 [Acidobacteriales bacterium]|nr:hypothetical protein [Terriglobales bacterium]
MITKKVLRDTAQMLLRVFAGNLRLKTFPQRIRKRASIAFDVIEDIAKTKPLDLQQELRLAGKSEDSNLSFGDVFL